MENDQDPNTVIELEVQGRVSVLWKDKGQSFEGTVEKIHPDGSCDVVYDALIEGSIRRETHVPRERITVINTMDVDDSYWNDSQHSTFPQEEQIGSLTLLTHTNSGVTASSPLKTNSMSALLLENNPTVIKICQISENGNEVTLEDLEDIELVALYDAFTTDKLINLAKSSASKLKQIFDAYVVRLDKFENISGIIETMNIIQGDFEPEAGREVNLLLRCMIAVVRISIILNNDRIKSEIHAPIPEEAFERVLRFLHSFCATNFCDLKKAGKGGGGVKSSPGMPSPSKNDRLKKEKIPDSLSKQFAHYVTGDFSKLFTSLLEVLQLFVRNSKPSNTVMILLIDLMFDVLRVDPSNNTIINAIDLRQRNQLMTWFKTAVSVVKFLYQSSSEAYRTMIEQQILQLLHDCYENKNPYRPLLVDNLVSATAENVTFSRISTGTYCLLSCVQSLIQSPMVIAKKMVLTAGVKKVSSSSSKPSAAPPNPMTAIEPEEMMGDCYHLISNILILLFQYCTNNKELSAEYYQVFQNLLQECLVAAQSPIWPSASIFVEKSIYAVLMQLKKVVDESGAGSAEAGNVKRDTFQINQMIDLLSALAEQVSLIEKDLQQTFPTSQTLASLLELSVPSGLTDGSTTRYLRLKELISQLIKMKWRQVQPLWLKLLAENQVKDEYFSSSDGYWETASPTKPSISRNNSQSSSVELLPYLKQLDSLIEINSDILDLLEERVGSFDQSKEIGVVLNDGAIGVTLSLLPSLHDTQDLARLLNEVQEVDVKYGRLLRYIIEQNGDYRFYRQDSSFDPWTVDDGLTRDACLFMISFWAQYKKYHQGRQESCPALLQLAIHLTESQITDFANPNIFQRTILPYFVQETKTQTRRLIQDLTRSIISQRSFQPLLVKLLEAFNYMIGDPSPLVRARSVKALSRFIQSNTNYFLQLDNSRLPETIISILYDRSIAVREEGVKLIGPIIASGYCHLNLGNRLLEELKPLLLDEGISVRKSVVLIIRDILQNQPVHVQYIDLCIRLLERLSTPKEEESIKETICAIFQQIWFSSPTLPAIQVMKSIFSSSQDQQGKKVEGEAGPENPYYQLGLLSRALSKGKSVSKEATTRDFKDFYTEFTALQLIEISLHEASHGWILTLLQELLHHKEKGNETSSSARQRREASYQHCERIVSFMKELLILIEENQHQAVKEFLVARQFSPADYKVAIIATIALFCEAHPPFVSQHLLTFLPYLKGDSDLTKQQNLAVSGYVMKILESVALLEKSNLSFVNPERILTDLANIILSHSGSNISMAISCLATLISNVTHDGTAFMALAEGYMRRLRQVVQVMPTAPSNNNPLPPEISAVLQRCLVVYGYLCEHSKKCKSWLFKLPSNYLSELEVESTVFKKQFIQLNERIARTNFAEVPDFDTRLFYGIGYSAVLYGLSLGDPTVQLRAIQCLCGIFAGYPRIMLLAKEDRLISRILSEEFNESIHERFLIGLKDMMMSEEKLLEKKASLQQMKESGVAIKSNRETVLGGAVDHDSDATIAGMVLQQFLPTLTQFLRRPSISLRYCTLQLLATLLRQGMICPLDILALAIMLLGDEHEEIRSESLKLLQIQDERFPNFLDSRLIEGIEHAHDFQLLTFRQLNPTLPKQREVDTSHSIFSNLYLTCIASNRKRKIQFLYGLLRRCLNSVIESASDSLSEASNSAFHTISNEGEAVASPLYSSPSKTTKSTGTSTPTRGKKSKVVKITEKTLLGQLESLQQQFSKVKYYAMTLATLPFMAIEEVLHIIHWIGRTTPTDCVLVLKKLEGLYGQVGGYLGVPTAETSTNQTLSRTPSITRKGRGVSSTLANVSASTNTQHDVLEQKMILDEEKWSEAVRPLVSLTRTTGSTASPDSPSIYQIVYDIVAYQYQLRCEEILLRLKSYFKIVYNLSDEKCQLFDPNDRTNTSLASSSERLSNDRYFDFELVAKDVTSMDAFVEKDSPLSQLLPSTQQGKKEKEGDRHTAWRQLFSVCLDDYNRLHHIIHTEGDDFKLESHLSSAGGHGPRRKRAAKTSNPSTAVSASGGKRRGRATSGKAKAPGSGKKGTKRKRLSYDDDEEDDDEDLDLPDDDDEEVEDDSMEVEGYFQEEDKRSIKRMKSTTSESRTPPVTPSRRGRGGDSNVEIVASVKRNPDQLFEE